MSHFELVQQIEGKADSLTLKDPYGELLWAPETLALVAKYHGEVWDAVWDAYLKGDVDGETAGGALCSLIEEYARDRHRAAVERTIADLKLDQQELGLVS
jgi:hypothetical protein